VIVASAFDSLGFDTSQKLTRAEAQAIKACGLVWGARYVGLAAEAAGDLDRAELEMLVGEVGFRLIVVQHVPLPGWVPTAALGEIHGRAATRNAAAAGYPAGCDLYIDDEGMAPAAGAAAARAYTESWAQVVRDGGYGGGAYIGAGSLMSPAQLYAIRGIHSYWAGPRRPGDRDVAVRGYQIQQCWPEVMLGGVRCDLDVLGADQLGARPWWCSPL
jgi:hypothetical protein